MLILLAEDDLSIQRIVGLTLERVGRHQVLYAKNGKETLSLAEKNPDLILLDIMMPELNGFECCQALKADPRTKHIPIIFLTARAQSQEVQKSISLGAIGCIVKPFDPVALPRQIEAMLAEHGKALVKDAS